MMFQSRDACKVLEDMRRCYEERNFACLPSLIMELDILSSRIECFLDMKEHYEKYHRELPGLRAEWRDLREKIRTAGKPEGASVISPWE